jgi:CRISPR/Cas system CMR-associated protein Cmr5 small subunit
MNRQRDYARKAHEKVLSFKTDNDMSKLKTLCMKSPALLHQSGLAQAFVFLESRGRYGVTYLNAVCDVQGGQTLDAYRASFLKAGLPLSDYMRMTQEMADVMAWMRRFAQVELKDVAADEGE